jgi:hypothetical protein
MRRQNREVNIFNMSLLDILCGALGAFCFLMLALLPDHAKAKQLQQQVDRMQAANADGQSAEQARQEAEEARKRAEDAEKKSKENRLKQSLAYFQVAWQGPQDIDIWLKMPDKRWVIPKKNAVPEAQLYGETGDAKGPGREQAWVTDVGYTSEVYELYAKLVTANNTAGPVRVTGYIAVRVATGPTTNSMTLYDLPAELRYEGEQLLLGTLTFPAGTDYKVTLGPRPQSQPSPQPPSSQK